jgi:hypothetical protein
MEHASQNNTWHLVTKYISMVTLQDMSPCSQYMNRRFGGKYQFHLQGRKSVEQESSVLAGG